MEQIQNWKRKQQLHDILQVWRLWNNIKKTTTYNFEYIPDREHNTYYVVHYFMHEERLHIWGDYQLVYEHKKEWKKGNDKNQIHNLKILGDKLKETKNELKTQQAEIKTAGYRE